MYWRSEKEIIEDFVKVLRRIFTYVETLTNKDKEIVTLPTGSIVNAIYESFASINEEYPQIRVDSGGMTFIDHLNNLVTVNAGEEIPLGYRPLKMITATQDFPITVTLPDSLNGISIRGFIIPHANIEYLGSSDIDVSLIRIETIYNGNLVSQNVSTEASGSLYGNLSQNYLNSFVATYPVVTIDLSTNISWYLEIRPRDNDVYTFAINEDEEGVCTYYEDGVLVTPDSAALHASAISPAFIRMGGGIEGSILIKSSSKDDSKTARNLASTIAIYCNLLKQTQISRKEVGYYADKLQLIFGTNEAYDEWLEKGIRIKNIRQNPINYRRRSSNEIIYESTIVIDVATEWFQDFNADNLEEIDVSVFLQQINAEINEDDIVIVKNIYDENYFITSDDEYFEGIDGRLVVS